MMLEKTKRILAISGSTRSNSINQSILKAIARRYPESLAVELYEELSLLPHFNPDLDKQAVAQTVANLRTRIAQADGVLICTPEYVFSLPGALKNALEWTVSTPVFYNKPVALITASGLGEKAHESLLLIMQTLQAKIGIHSTMLIQGASSKVSKQGEITDPDTMKDIERLMDSFMETMQENRQAASQDDFIANK